MKACRFCGSKVNLHIQCHYVRNGRSYEYYSCRRCSTARARAYRKTKSGKKSTSSSTKRYEKRNKEKARAWDAVQRAKLGKKPCAVCGSTKRIHWHHDDYSKPLDVIPLCPAHHKERHLLKDKKTSIILAETRT